MGEKKVEKGERYWCVELRHTGLIIICHIYGEDAGVDETNDSIGNCFSTYAEAEIIAKKLRAVLNGADVIEMPSEVEMSQQAVDIAWKRQNEYYDENGESVICYGECYDSASDMYNWLKSKIVE